MRVNVGKALAEISGRDAERIAERVRIAFRKAHASNGSPAMVPSDVERLLAIAVDACARPR
jgi:hypothetical protein